MRQWNGVPLMLQGRVLRTGDQREFVKATWDGTNRSGITPLDDKVLIRMDEHAERTSGGIVIPDDARSRQSMASETGVVIALGAAAFEYSDDGARNWRTAKPAPGDRVVVERYAGRVVQGQDSVEYRLVSQKSVGALYDKQE
jgi:chaperonin GroES